MKHSTAAAIFIIPVLVVAYNAMHANGYEAEQYACNEESTVNRNEKTAFDDAIALVQIRTRDAPPAVDGSLKGAATASEGRATVYAKAFCSSGLTKELCFRCLQAANSALKYWCVSRKTEGNETGELLYYPRGARVLLRNCSMRVEFFDFSVIL